MARAISKVAPDWWDYTTLDAELLEDAAKLTERRCQLSRSRFQFLPRDARGLYLAKRLVRRGLAASSRTTRTGSAADRADEQLPLVARIVTRSSEAARRALLGHGRVVRVETFAADTPQLRAGPTCRWLRQARQRRHAEAKSLPTGDWTRTRSYDA